MQSSKIVTILCTKMNLFNLSVIARVNPKYLGVKNNQLKNFKYNLMPFISH